ncbi:ficolin-1 [Elysia marginata]|uniref:Ficolin-1 n=1 Tax=Elysia marginata TaxID=1093978 RepID=A0AAV4GLS3_9GAST|nr:ficolin-1 [Elysia marginata]
MLKNSERFAEKVEDIKDKLWNLSVKLSAEDSFAIQDRVINTMKIQINEHSTKLQNASEITNDALSKTASLLLSLNSQSENFQLIIREYYQNLLGNVTRGVEDLFIGNRNFTQTLQNQFHSFKDDVNFTRSSIESRENSSTGEIRRILQIITEELITSFASQVESSLTGFFMPESCKKNRSILLHPNATPYPVKYRTEFPDLNTPILCDTISDGGGWIIIQRRSTGTVNFYRDWEDYRDGFGTLDNDFWLGNEKIHSITNSGRYELRVILVYLGKRRFANYNKFSLADEDKNYTLTLGTYRGTAGNSLTYHNGQQFSTYDRDNDKDSVNCAEFFTGAWWYKNLSQLEPQRRVAGYHEQGSFLGYLHSW